MKGASHKLIVKRIFDLLNSENSNEQIIIDKIESEFEISTDEAQTVLELTKTGLFRASFISKGLQYPTNNLSDNPIVIAAQKLTLEKLNLQKKKWWLFWTRPVN